jgi:nitrite reductase/ring-hydroxylating ferredoxin subunit
MNALIESNELSALPVGRGRRVRKAGLDLAMFRLGEAVYAVDANGPHAGGSLSNGKRQGARVTCPVHGLKFNLKNVCPSGSLTLESEESPRARRGRHGDVEPWRAFSARPIELD